MCSQVSTTFPDSTYTSANKPSVETLKSDISAIETAHNDTDTNAVKTTDTDISSNSWVLDEDAMGSNSNQKVATQQSIKAYVDAQITASKSALYPVGCIYTNITGTNPGTELGFGTWTAFGAGRALWGYDSGDTDFDTVEETGGAKTHTLTEAEMPVHNHGVTDPTHRHSQNAENITREQGGYNNDVFPGSNEHKEYTDYASTGISIKNAGSGNAHSIQNKYIVVHFWKRTA